MKSSKTDKLFEKAEAFRQKSRYSESLELFNQALKAYTSSRNFSKVMECQLSTGDVCRMIGDFDRAEKSYTAAIKTAMKIHDAPSLADAQIGIGLSLRARGEWEKALKMISSAMDFYQSTGDKHGIAFSLWATAGSLRI
ncbi:MAG: tetratricopeptide repeat protein, partial [Nitrospirae bacterium]|nr:tetratricopeptide repeat protein [Nitrospirota bacterium]